MNRSHKHQLQKLQDQNEYTEEDLEIAKELLNQHEEPFHQQVEEITEKIKNIINEQKIKHH